LAAALNEGYGPLETGIFPERIWQTALPIRGLTGTGRNLPPLTIYMLMKANSCFSVSLFFTLVLHGALLPAAHAQRADNIRPANDPFGRRVLPARAVPGGRYKSHLFVIHSEEVTGNVQKGPISSSSNFTLQIKSTDGSTLRIRPWALGVIKVEYFAPTRSLQADSSLSVVQKPDLNIEGTNETGIGSSKTSHKASPITETTAAIELRLPAGESVRIDKRTLRVSIRQQEKPIIEEATGAFRRVAAAPVSSNNSAAATFTPGGTAVRFRLAPGERLYGTGSRALPVDRRGYRLELYNQAHYASQNGEPNLNIALPTVLSSRGYMLFFDHHTAGYLDLGKTDKNVLEYGGENLTSLSYFVITGRDQAEILNRYTALTGRQPLPPRWALGLIQSRFGYKTEAEMQQVATRMRRENFPLDALVLDLYWFGGTTRQGDLSWHKPGFPDPVGMMSSLKKQGVKTILISEPYVMRTSRNDSTVRTQGLVGTTAAGRPFTVASFWAGPASILDVFKPATRDWLWGYYRTLHNQGAAGWWSDLGEPENHPEAMQHAAGPTRAVHNAYGQVWAGILQDNYTKEFPDERVFNLARSGWAGLQRNSVFPWSGDIQRSWSGYQAQVPVMLGMGQGGVGYMHSDAGGFCVGGIDSELYTRWLQMASLCPILRPHGEGVPPEPYYYPEPYKSAVRNAVQLRYQLLPYLYTLAWQNTTTGTPLVRSMDFGSDIFFQREAAIIVAAEADPWARRNVIDAQILQSDERQNEADALRLANLNDQYLLGPNLLVAPVLHPSQRRRNVVLPGGNWIDFYTNQTYAGGRTVGVPAPLAHTPLLVRAGAFLPMTAYRPSTAQYRPDTLLLRYYPDSNVSESEFTLYDDDGHTAQALARRHYETLTARGFCTPTQTDVILSSNGEYPGQPVFRLLRLLVQRVAAPPTAVYLDNKLAPAEGYTYDPIRHELEVHFLMNAGVAVSIRGLQLLDAPTASSAPETLTLESPDNRSFGSYGTTLRYTRHAGSTAANAQLSIRNAQGKVVRVLPLETSPGSHALPWDGRDDARQPVPPGVYVAETDGQHQRLIVTR
jgi:alpha-glucosidase (family GH31 glycosyl hydrolase)